MDITIDKVLLCGMFSQGSEPVMTGAEAVLGAEAEEYLAALAARAFASDDTRECKIPSDRSYDSIFGDAAAAFIPVSCALAKQLFAIMTDHPSIPDAQMAFMLLHISGIEHFAALKLNFRQSYISYAGSGDGGDIRSCNTVLTPIGGKADEAFFIDLITREARISEKKYDIDGVKSVYISTKLLDCRPGRTPKEKLAAVCDAAVEVNAQFYSSLGVDDTAVALAVSEEYHLADTGNVCASEICERLYKDLPHARQAFEKVLAEQDVPFDEGFTVSAPAVRRMEKQSLRSGSGVEIKVPVSVYRDPLALEFIKDDDGTTSLLIKNVLI